MSNTFRIRLYFIIPALLVIAAAGISPFIEALSTSFYSDIYGTRTFAGLDNFRYLRGDAGFAYSLNITTLWALCSTFMSLVTGFLIAVALSSRRKLSGILYGLLLIPWGIPVYIAVPLWRAFIHGNGGISILTAAFGIQANLMTDPVAGFAGCLAVSTWMTAPLTAFVLFGAIKKIPESSVEAAVLDGADRGVIAAHIYLPQIKGSLVIMGMLNFIKAFKEFTLVFLMTDGGPPLLSGITERYVIGATTTLDTFLYEVFNNTDNYGISSAYSVTMAAIVVLLMMIWFTAQKEDLRPHRKHTRFVIVTAVLQLIFSWPAGIFFFLLYIAGIKSRRIFSAAVAVHSGWIIYSIITSGFLEGFSPGIFPALFTLFYSRISPDRIRLGQGNIRHIRPALINSLNGTFSMLAIIFMSVSSVVIVYMLIWMSFSGVSACYVDSFLPPHAGIEGYKRIFLDENILHYFGNTLAVAGATAVLVPIISFPAAVWLCNRGRRTTAAALTVIQILSITGGMHSLIPLYASFERIGLVNSYVPLVIISLYHSLPFSLFTITVWLEHLPASFRDIALIDGVPTLAWLHRIILPLSRPVLATAVIAALNGAWNSFMAPLLFLNEDRLYTISVKLYSFVGSIASGAPEWNIFAAASVVNCLIIGLLFSRFRKPAGDAPVSEFTE